LAKLDNNGPNKDQDQNDQLPAATGTGTNTTTTVSTTVATQTGTKIVVDTQANTIAIGDFVTDVSIQPYIAPRIIAFYAYNMRPNHQMHIFFDGVNVDQYCAPGIIPASVADTSDYRSIAKNGNYGDPINTDDNGQVSGWFNIPAATFKSGDRLLQISDVESLALGNDAFSTISSAHFTASNLNVTKKTVTMTTVNPVLSYVPISNTVVTTNTNVTITRIKDIIDVTAFYEPIAQGLTINTPEGEAGIYATSLDIFFKQKSLIGTNGVTVYLCEIDNGYPNGNAILPFSTVHLNYGSINVSEDSSVATNFKFESPVFLNNGKEYAFIVKPDANDPDYYVYSANLGDIDLATGYQVFSQPTIGTAFYGATMSQWTALQTEYIKFRLNRAKFANNSGEAYFYNSNTDYLTPYNIAYSNTSMGILPGDYIFQATSNSIATVNTSISGILNYYNTDKGILYIDNSTGNFTNNSFIQVHRFVNATAITPNAATIVAWANTLALHNPRVNALVPQFATLVPGGTSLTFNYTGTSNAYVVNSSEYKITPGYDTEFLDSERIVASRSIENALMANAKSMTIHATMTTDSDYLSPLIDLVKYNQLVIGNEIDPVEFNYQEFLSNGPAKTKYISQIVTLADGQDAQDLQVILTAFRPNSTDIQVWVKFLNGEDTDPISQKTWTPLINKSNTLYSDPSNPDDFREYVFTTPIGFGMIPTTGTITVANSTTTVTGIGTNFTTELSPGWFINMRANATFSETTRQVVSITNSTSLVLDSAFNGNYTTNAYFLVPPPTTAYMAANNQKQLFAANGSNATVSVSNVSNIITGTNTNFTVLLPRTTILVNGDEQKITNITNSTSLSVGTPWSSTASGANAYIRTTGGLTYLNKNNNLYTNFKRFQIKIILQSDDSSAAPLLNDLRALAMQL